jgi:hypothetical protein
MGLGARRAMRVSEGGSKPGSTFRAELVGVCPSCEPCSEGSGVGFPRTEGAGDVAGEGELMNNEDWSLSRELDRSCEGVAGREELLLGVSEDERRLRRVPTRFRREVFRERGAAPGGVEGGVEDDMPIVVESGKRAPAGQR